MNTKALEGFAKAARRELISAVAAQASTVLADGSVARTERVATVRRLEEEIAAYGREHVIDKVAYTWFNRLIALRFMDARGYTGIGIVSPVQGQAHGQPEILAEAKRGEIDVEVVTATRVQDAIIRLLDGTRRSTDAEGEAYALLLTEYCRYWHKAMPFMFEAEGDYTELLVPAGLLADGGILSHARDALSEEVCDDVEVIGWLYQFYISERKDEVFAGFKKNKKAGAEEIPAATQLFTPHWIVRYLVENSVGRIWMLNRPNSRIVNQMEYYIAPVDEETDFLKISGPEELTVIDPACGSGHMLTYAFDLLYAIYEEEGYAPSNIPSLILTHNLHGTEIDPRAGSLAAFALTMKARAKDRRFFTRRTDTGTPTQPAVCVIKPISFRPDELDFLVTKSGDRREEETFWNQFEHADTFGSLIRPDALQTKNASTVLEQVDSSGGLLYSDTVGRAQELVRQAEMLSAKYSVVIANPPYMGSKQMNALLSQFMKDEYPTGKADLMTAFMVLAQELTVRGGTWAMINLPSWMSLKSFESMRLDLLKEQRIVSMVHLGRGIFGSDFGSVAFVIDNVAAKESRGTYRRLFEQHVDVRSVSAIESLFRDSTYNNYEVQQSDFAAIPGSPIVYWLSEKLRAAFSQGETLGDQYNAMNGMTTGENAKFLRFWHEVSEVRTCRSAHSAKESVSSAARWFPYNKGGEFRKWYGNQEHVVNWEHDGRDVVENGRAFTRGRKFYFHSMVSWAKVSSGQPAFRFYPEGFLFDVAGTALFGESVTALFEAMSMCNSSTSEAMLAALSPTLNFESGQIAKLPVAVDQDLKIDVRVSQLVSTSKFDWDQQETSWGFTHNPLVTAFQVSETGIRRELLNNAVSQFD